MPPLRTHSEITERILKGQSVVVYAGHALLIPKQWLDAHPGGTLSILHFVGRDATDEIESYHPTATLDIIRKYSIGTVQLPWQPLVPPISIGWTFSDGQWLHDATVFSAEAHGTGALVKRAAAVALQPTLSAASLIPPKTSLDPKQQIRISGAYRALHQRVTDSGLYETRWITGVGPELCRYAILAATSAFAYAHNWQLTSAFALGLLWYQLVFFVHDLGHMGVSGNWYIDRIFSITLADFVGGLSIGWWVQNHNVHHLVTNHVSHDPDIEHLPFFAISPSFFSNIYSTYYKRTLPFDEAARVIIAIQHKLFYLVMLFARFNLFKESYVWAFQKAFDTRRAKEGRWAWILELVGMATFLGWYSAVLYGCGSWQKALAYLVVSNVTPSPLHVQLVLSHFSMSTEDLGPYECFAHRQLRTTSDVSCPPWLDFLHGGLNLQTAHHLFPRMPRHNLRKATMMVKQFAKEEGLEFHEFGFVDGNKDVLGVLRNVAEQARILGQVASRGAKDAVDRKLGLSS